MRRLLTLSLALLIGQQAFAQAGEAGGGPPRQQPKIKVEKLDDLPKHTYPCHETATALMRSEEHIRELATAVREDIEADLARYDIKDATTLQRMYGTLLSIALVDQDYATARRLVLQIRTLEDKEAKKLTSGLVTESFIAARRSTEAAVPSPEFRKAFRQSLDQALGQLAWKVVEDVIQQNKARLEMLSENLIAGIAKAQMDPVIEKTGELNADMAAGIIGFHLLLTQQLPLKEEILGAYQTLIDAHKSTKSDIWAARAASLENANCGPVLAAVWDSGTDPAIFRSHLWINPQEEMNGKDDDGNGFVDDVHGIAYDIHAQRTTGLLVPLGEAAERMPTVMKYMKGLMDMQAALDSPEATDLKKHLSELDPQAVKGFLEDLGLAGNYAHGTHVAGIMAAGNPCIQLLIARLSYDHRTVPVARTEEWGRRDAAKIRDTVDYFKKHGVRVVNMSWGEAQEDAEDSLEKNGIGESAEERRELARKVFGYQREALFDAIKFAPDILFVCAAGNADNDVEFDEYIPSSFDLPNLLVVGAVDQAGEPTSFTSFGRTVRIYASGFEVESYVPGGEQMAMSGTSMASPNVANLAAKLLALQPSLTPAQVIDYIMRGADLKVSGTHSYRLLNPKKSIELLRAELDTAGSDS